LEPPPWCLTVILPLLFRPAGRALLTTKPFGVFRDFLNTE